MSHSVGFIGLGVMGRPMARFILAAQLPLGGSLHIHDLERSRVTELLDAGAVWGQTPAELAAACDTIIVMVPEIKDIRSLLDRPEGLLAGTVAPWTLVVSSTCSPQEVRDLQTDLTAGGHPVTVVDAPVSGGAEGAESGTLVILLGGEPDAVTPVQEILSAAGTATLMGPLGAGQVAKACNQLIVAAEVVALAEASLIAERAGLDVAQLFDVLGRGYAASRVMEVKAHRFATHDHSPSGPAKFMIKDLRAVAEEADVTGIRTVSVEPLRAVFGDLTADGLGDYDTSVVQQFIESRSKPAPE